MIKECYSCGSNESYRSWWSNIGTGLYLCRKCFRHLYYKHTEEARLKKREEYRRNIQSYRDYNVRNAEKLRIKSKEFHKSHPNYIREYNQKHKDEIRENKSRRFEFLGKTLLAESNPRINVCSNCGRVVGDEIKRTNIHHKLYDTQNPLAHTVELCVGCHRKAHTKERLK